MDVLTLPKLYDLVVARFEDEETAVASLFGWRTPYQTEVRGPRLCWVPGDPSGGLGELGVAYAQVLGDGNPRVLSTLRELFTIYLITADEEAPENERKQYEAARELFNGWWRAVFLAGNATVKPLALNWIADKKVRLHGAGIRAVCGIYAPIPDQTLDVVPADATSNNNVSLLDRTENFTAPPPPEEAPPPPEEDP